MQRLLDVLASGIHDTKNQLFVAESLIAAREAEHRIDLGEARYAIEAAAQRLSRTLAAYHLFRHGAHIAIVPTILADLCAEIRLAQHAHLASSGIALSVDCPVLDAWPLDRDLVGDMLGNAVQNAGRFARSQVRLSALETDGGLLLRVDDDGPGFRSIPPRSGTGLMVAERLAQLHARGERHGALRLSNDSALGGARFELLIP